MRGKAPGELWGSREHWSCPKAHTTRDPLPWVNPLSTRLWDQTPVSKARQRSDTQPKTFDRCAMANLAPHGAPGSASVQGKNGTDTWTRDKQAEVTSAGLARARGSHVCS